MRKLVLAIQQSQRYVLHFISHDLFYHPERIHSLFPGHDKYLLMYACTKKPSHLLLVTEIWSGEQMSMTRQKASFPACFVG